MKAVNLYTTSVLVACLGLAVSTSAIESAPKSTYLPNKAATSATAETDQSGQRDNIEGHIVAIDRRDNMAKVRPESGFGLIEVPLSKNLQISGLRSGDASNLRRGDEIILHYSASAVSSDKTETSAVTETSQAEQRENVKGVIVAIDRRNNMAKVRPQSGFGLIEVPLSDNLKISGLRSGDATNLQRGDQVTLHYSASADSAEKTNTSGLAKTGKANQRENVKGVIVAIDKKNNMAKVRSKSGSDLIDVELSNDLKISGLRSGRANSLREGDEVILHFSSL